MTFEPTRCAPFCGFGARPTEYRQITAAETSVGTIAPSFGGTADDGTKRDSREGQSGAVAKAVVTAAGDSTDVTKVDCGDTPVRTEVPPHATQTHATATSSARLRYTTPRRAGCMSYGLFVEATK